MFWNCACLISDAGGNETKLEENEANCVQEEGTEEEDDEEGTKPSEKKKSKTTNYGRIAAAIGKIKATGVEVSPPNINNSSYTFSPDIEHNRILYGLSGIVKVGNEIVQNIIANRPYISIADFLGKVKVNKTQMINLIKCGAFDEFGDREKIMRDYIDTISDKKKRLTLQNMKMLCDYNLLPEQFDFEKRIFNYTKYLKKFKDGDKYYKLDNIAYNFYESNFDIDLLEVSDSESGFSIDQKKWDKIYKSYMDNVKAYIKENQEELLSNLNQILFDEVWKKYCLGSLSKWEMDSVNCYFHSHELSKVDLARYDVCDFARLPEEPPVARWMRFKGKEIPIYDIHRIAGTVLDKDKAKKTVTLLTNTGVVNVKIFGEVFSNYDRQLSERGADGVKHVIEKSWFSRGNKIIVCGIRQEDSFRAKKYKATPYHLVELITEIDGEEIITQDERTEVVS